MSIEFHCDHCGKLIRAPRSAAGRRGKCPSCQQSVYIRTPADEIEDVPLAPIDEAAEAAERRADEEARRLAHQLLHEQDPGPDSAPSQSPPTPAESLTPEMLEESVVAYLQALAESRLERAESIADQLAAQADEVSAIADRIAQDSIPPAGCENIPAPVLRGFLKSLREQIESN